MTESRDVSPETVGSHADLERLRKRVKELERQIRTEERSPTPKRTPDRTKIAATFAGLSAVLAVPAFITFRRWIRWWN